MAERRMFSKKVTDDDNFMALSSSAQALYLHLSMSADDDGFCNQVSISMFKAHASVQDLQSLLENRYIYQFESGVIVIKHWRMANALRKDRYTPTIFQNELSKLDVKNNGVYEWLPNGCQMVAERLPQDRLGKVRLGKVIKNSSVNESSTQEEKLDYEKEFESLWELYPNKKGKANALKTYIKVRTRKKNPVTFEQVEQGINNYIFYIKEKKMDMQYIKNGSTWFNQECWNDDYSVYRKEKKKTFWDIANELEQENT